MRFRFEPVVVVLLLWPTWDVGHEKDSSVILKSKIKREEKQMIICLDIIYKFSASHQQKTPPYIN